jgi:hypothetical protein
MNELKDVEGSGIGLVVQAIARMREKWNVYRLLVGKSEGKRLPGRPAISGWITLRWIL